MYQRCESCILDVHACKRMRVCMCANSVRREADWRPDCHGFALSVQHHSKVEIGHEIFLQSFPFLLIQRRAVVGHFVDLAIKQLVDGTFRNDLTTFGSFYQLGII